MMADGLWIDRRHRQAFPPQPRWRRECLGELVEIDGSENAWLEDRGKTCTTRRRPENVWVAEIESGRTRHQSTNLRGAFVESGSPDADALVGRIADSAP
jgi:hypothetical protein